MEQLHRSSWWKVIFFIVLAIGAAFLGLRTHLAGAAGEVVVTPHCAFVGLVMERPDSTLGVWRINDIPVIVDKRCQFDEGMGKAVVGAWVSVAATCTNGEVRPYAIRVITPPTSQRRKVDFREVIQAIDSSHWLVGGTNIAIREGTRIIGAPAVGKIAQVEAEESIQGLVARRIVVLNRSDLAHEVAFSGTIQELDHDVIVVDDHRIHISATTALPDHLQVGQQIDIQAIRADGGQIVAQRIAPAPDQNESVRFSGWINSIRNYPDQQVWQIAEASNQGQISHFVNAVVDGTSAVDERHGVAKVGAWVHIEAAPDYGNTLHAQVVRVEKTPATYFTGVVQQMPAEHYLGYWRIADLNVEVNKSTLVIGEQPFSIGNLVSVHGRWAADGHIIADMIVHAGQE